MCPVSPGARFPTSFRHAAASPSRQENPPASISLTTAHNVIKSLFAILPLVGDVQAGPALWVSCILTHAPCSGTGIGEGGVEEPEAELVCVAQEPGRATTQMMLRSLGLAIPCPFTLPPPATPPPPLSSRITPKGESLHGLVQP